MVAMLRSAALTGYAELARELGLDAERLAAAAGLPRAALEAPDLRVPAEPVARLLELSAAAAGVEDLGLRLGTMRELSNLGLMAVVARAAPTPRAALAVIGRYLRLHNEAVSMRLERLDGAWFVGLVTAVPAARSLRQSVGLSLVVLHRALVELLGEDWRPELACLPYPPPRDLSRHRRIFGPGLQFDAAATGLVCSDAMMDRRRTAGETLLSREARAVLEVQLDTTGPGTAAKAREAIAWLLPTGLCSAETVAGQLGLERRTLQRHLVREGTSYAALVDDHRRDLVRQQLAEGGRPLKEVAARLGFEAPSVLSRWFRARFGCSPAEWSRQGGRSALSEQTPDCRRARS
jgi:AraC-like DNA-binding protein